MLKQRTKSQEKRTLILQSSTHLFTEQGFAHTSMEQIAQHAGVSKQTVYSHFGSKDGLFKAAIECRCAEHQLSEADFTQFDDAETALRTIAARFVELIQSYEAIQVYRTCVAQVDKLPHIPELYFESGPQLMITQLSACLSHFHQLGQLDIDEPRFAAVQLLQLIQGENRMRNELGLKPVPSEEHRRYVDSCMTLFLKTYLRAI